MDWVELGYWGMFFSSILAATILPLGSEAVFLGLLYADFENISLIIIASVGNTIGGMTTYYLGRLGKWEWLGKWFGIDHSYIQEKMGQAQKYGWVYAFLTWLPFIGDPLAALIGFARVQPLTTLFWMFLGKTLRFIVIALLWNYGVS